MKYKLGKKLPPKEKRKEEFVLEDASQFWWCEKCNIIYGKGEKILRKMEDNKGYYDRFCLIHPKQEMTWAEFNYWEDRYELEKLA